MLWYDMIKLRVQNGMHVDRRIDNSREENSWYLRCDLLSIRGSIENVFVS